LNRNEHFFSVSFPSFQTVFKREDIMVSANLMRDMKKKKIDIDLTLSILDDFNDGLYDSANMIHVHGVPSIDGETVIDLRSNTTDNVVFSREMKSAKANLARQGLSLPSGIYEFKAVDGNKHLGFTSNDLYTIGRVLVPVTAYGVLNGGSATSYVDRKKNQALSREVFSALVPWFDSMAERCKDMPKGLTPAYINPDGSEGASFLELKMRARLLTARDYVASRSQGAAYGINAENFMPLFQMTSVGNDTQIRDAYSELVKSPFLEPLAKATGLKACRWETGIQPMIAAYTHSCSGRPKGVFDHAYGKADSALPLPGGHGQSFRVLAPVFKNLRERGIRYAYLGNVDNMAYVPDPREIAILAISGMPAGFDFSFKTAVDVKGGILVETMRSGVSLNGFSRTVADIGPAIGLEDVLDLERKGQPILFNCASGIFDLDYLVTNIDDIARRLPVRFTDQDKDAGKYSQAEQVTWEVTGLLPSFAAFAVDKYDRFLAAKLLVETLLTSGMGLNDPVLPSEIRDVSTKLHGGLENLLKNVCGLELKNGRWIPAGT
jgi:hypothetical protein